MRLQRRFDDEVADSQHLASFYSDHQWIYINYFIMILIELGYYTVCCFYNYTLEDADYAYMFPIFAPYNIHICSLRPPIFGVLCIFA